MDHPADADPAFPIQEKAALRAGLRAAAAAMSGPERAVQSARVAAVVVASEAFARAGTIMVYASLPDEIDPAAIALAVLRAGKRVAYPRAVWETKELLPVLPPALLSPPCGPGTADPTAGFVPGRLALREAGPECAPVAPGEIDLVVVPALAYDRAGNRLGRGAGFYDRFLARPDLRAATIGVVFGHALLDIGRVPTGPHDLPVDAVVTGLGQSFTRGTGRARAGEPGVTGRPGMS